MPHERKNERVESSVLIEAQNWNFAAAFVGLATIIELHKASERTKVQHIFFITVCDDPIAHKKNSFWREFFILLKMAFFSSYACKLCLWNLNERLHNTHTWGERKDEIENYCLVPEIQWIVKAIESEMLYMFMGAIEINFKEISYNINIPHNRYRFFCSSYFNNFISLHNDSLVWVASCVYKIKLNEPECVYVCSHINFYCSYVLFTEGISFIKLKIIIMLQS